MSVHFCIVTCKINSEELLKVPFSKVLLVGPLPGTELAKGEQTPCRHREGWCKQRDEDSAAVQSPGSGGRFGW